MVIATTDDPLSFTVPARGSTLVAFDLAGFTSPTTTAELEETLSVACELWHPPSK